MDLGEAEQDTAGTASEVIAILQVSLHVHHYRYRRASCYGCNLSTFECSDQILFTTTLNLPALKNAKRYLTAMDNEGLGSDKVRLIVNRHISQR